MATAAAEMSPLLKVSKLSVSYAGDTTVHAVRDLSFSISAGETLGIVGESGSGKTQTALALMGLLPETARVSGSAAFALPQPADLLQLGEQRLNRLRGSVMTMIFQDPMTALNPHLTIGRQMTRVLERHRGLSRRAALADAARMLDAVRVPEAQARLRQYPHEMSGGMRQRIMIATALLCRPALLIADEPTTALDVTVQAQILELMAELQRELGTAMLLITHDMGVVAANCDRVLVMKDGELRESGGVDAVFAAPADAYTRALLAAVPRLDSPSRAAAGRSAPKDSDTDRPTLADRSSSADQGAAAAGGVDREPSQDGEDDRVAGSLERSDRTRNTIRRSRPGLSRDEPLLIVDDLRVTFDAGRARLFGPKRTLRAVDGVSFELRAGETLGVVGESGCGKSTLARAVLQLLDHYQGRVVLLGDELGTLSAAALKAHREDMQVVFQDPLASLNPRMTVGDIIGEPLRTFKPHLTREQRLQQVQELLAKVGLQPEHAWRYPHEFSGGQCQRIGIARALISGPQLVICDEPVSALDVSVQAQVIDLLMQLQQELGLALIFIAHDLAVVRQISHRVMVMYLGRIAELADSNALYEQPQHPYTRALIDAVPIPDPVVERGRKRRLLQGDLPSPLHPPDGCVFRTRCPLAASQCAAESPQLREVNGALVACHFPASA